MKKLFGGIDLTWKKLIIFAILSGVYTAIMTLIPYTYNTSFRDIAIQFEWWILFGIIIICNSKSNKDSALKCFIFFLISQPLIYLIQVPFNDQGFGIFRYYKYWFMWTILTLPMGYIGYYIKKNNIISAIILLPMLLFLSYLGLGYLSACLDKFPHHLLSFIWCYLFIIIITLGVLDKKVLRIISLVIVLISSILFFVLNDGLSREFETYRSLDEYNLNIEGEPYISYFTSTKKGNVEIIKYDDNKYNLKLTGRAKGEYKFEIISDNNITYEFEYYFSKEEQTVILKYIGEKEED